MRKHNKKMAARWGRTPGDTSNFAQSMAHKLVNDKQFQMGANGLLCKLIGKGAL